MAFTNFVYGDPTISPAILSKVAIAMRGPLIGSGSGSSGPIPVAVVLPPGYTSAFYSETITSNGGTFPYTYTISSGSLPTGLSLSSAGVISGIPTALGTFNFTVQAIDNSGVKGSEGFSITVNNPPANNYGYTS